MTPVAVMSTASTAAAVPPTRGPAAVAALAGAPVPAVPAVRAAVRTRAVAREAYDWVNASCAKPSAGTNIIVADGAVTVTRARGFLMTEHLDSRREC